MNVCVRCVTNMLTYFVLIWEVNVKKMLALSLHTFH